MPVDKETRNNPSPQRRGNPSDTGQSKASIKEVPDSETLKAQDELLEKYGDEEEGIVDPDALRGSHPNRNTQKPDTGKPPYS